MSDDSRKVPRRIAQAVLNSLKGGVVPRIGLPYIAVGRKSEIEALLHDVDIISEGGASFRFIVGRYGSGKSFLIQTIRNYVMDRGYIVADADLSPERRLQGTRGQGLATYRELVSNLSTKTKPEGGALTLVLDRWISSMQSQAMQETGLMPGDPGLSQAVDRKIYEVISAISELVHGFEFAHLVSTYYHAYLDGLRTDVLHHGGNLSAHDVGRHGMDGAHAASVLHGYGRDGRSGIAAQGRDGFHVGLDACAAATVTSGDAEYGDVAFHRQNISKSPSASDSIFFTGRPLMSRFLQLMSWYLPVSLLPLDCTLLKMQFVTLMS